MNIEHEIKILDIDVSEVTLKLESNGFVKEKDINFRRYVYTIPGDANSWLRLRTDGTKTTLTLKKYVKDTIDGMEETEIIVNDFDTANKLVESLGFITEKYQENRRTIFTKEGTDYEVSLDEWPHIPAYLEIESSSQNDVEVLVATLGLDKAQSTSAPTSEVYQRYGLDINSYSQLTF